MNELEKFDKKRIKNIQEKYKVTKIDKVKHNYFDKLKADTKRYQKVIFYMESLDNKKIREEDIPSEYIEEIRERYCEEIRRLERMIKNNSNKN